MRRLHQDYVADAIAGLRDLIVAKSTNSLTWHLAQIGHADQTFCWQRPRGIRQRRRMSWSHLQAERLCADCEREFNEIAAALPRPAARAEAV